MDSESYKHKKWSTVFEFLDVNHDGFIDYQEFMDIPTRLEESGKSEIASTLRRIHRQYWEKMVNILQKNHNVSLSDWITALTVISQTPWYIDNFVPAIADWYFKSVDLNNDGSISLDEWRQFQRDRGIQDETVVKYTFHKLDTDGDGSISPAEIKSAVLNFFLNEDPSEDPSDDYSSVYCTKQ